MNYIHLVKRLPRFGVQVSFGFEQETIVLFGPSGAGKSLTLQGIAGLLAPDAGRIEVAGRVLFDSEKGINLPPQQRRIGYVMQDYALFPHMSVEENLRFGLWDLSPAEQRTRVGEMVELLRLQSLQRRRPAELSGGQQQRVALGRALVTRPDLLLLDEPFAALDTPLRARLRRELLALQRRLRLPTIIVTHDLAEAHMLADRMAVLHDGTLQQIGTPETVLHRPATLEVARFTGARNIFVGTLGQEEDGWWLDTRRARLRVQPPPDKGWANELVTGVIRPEKVILVRPGAMAERGARQETLLQGQIVDELDHGLYHTLFVHLCPSQSAPDHVDLEVELSERVYRLLDIPRNREWALSLQATDIHLIGLAPSPYFEGPAPQPSPGGDWDAA